MEMEKNKYTDRSCDGLYGITLFSVNLEKAVDFFLFKECGKRLGRLGTTVHFESDPRFCFSVEEVEKVLCRLSRSGNSTMRGIGGEF
jgi:hypothetical protein